MLDSASLRPTFKSSLLNKSNVGLTAVLYYKCLMYSVGAEPIKFADVNYL